MTTENASATARLAAAVARIEGMKVTNEEYLQRGETPPRGEEEFFREAAALEKLADELESAHKVTALPDASPDAHWIYAPWTYAPGADFPEEMPPVPLLKGQRKAVTAAIRYAIRAMTVRGRELNFDPDDLVRLAVRALCGPLEQGEEI